MDPRRSFKPLTAQDHDEQLSKYEPIIPLDPRSILSRVDRLERVVSLGGERESVSIVVATGPGGLVHLQLSPSRTFDLLSNDFNKSQLVATLSVLTIALGITHRIVSST